MRSLVLATIACLILPAVAQAGMVLQQSAIGLVPASIQSADMHGIAVLSSVSPDTIVIVSKPEPPPSSGGGGSGRIIIPPPEIDEVETKIDEEQEEITPPEIEEVINEISNVLKKVIVIEAQEEPIEELLRPSAPTKKEENNIQPIDTGQEKEIVTPPEEPLHDAARKNTAATAIIIFLLAIATIILLRTEYKLTHNTHKND